MCQETAHDGPAVNLNHNLKYHISKTIQYTTILSTCNPMQHNTINPKNTDKSNTFGCGNRKPLPCHLRYTIITEIYYHSNICRTFLSTNLNPMSAALQNSPSNRGSTLGNSPILPSRDSTIGNSLILPSRDSTFGDSSLLPSRDYTIGNSHMESSYSTTRPSGQ